MNTFFSQATFGLIAACASTLVSGAMNSPVCGLDCWTPPTWHPDCGSSTTNNTFCANAWNSDGSGFQCLAVGDDKKSFFATSHWKSTTVTTVKSFPHVKLGSPVLPLELQNITSLRFNVEWGLGRNDSRVALDPAVLSQVNPIGNVALDIWADADPVRAANESVANIEIMIWLGVFGNVNPLGWDKPPHGRQTIGDIRFTLYVGSGPSGQNVLSWIPETNYTRISHDFSPLVTYLIENKLVSPLAYVGTVAFGAESFFNIDPATFSARSLDLLIGSTSAADPALKGSCRSSAGIYRPGALCGWIAGFLASLIAFGVY